MKKKENVWQNNIYVLRLIHQASPGRIPFYFLSIFLQVATNFLFNAFLLRLVINSVQTGRDFADIVSYIIIVGTILVVYCVLNNYFTEIFIPVSDRIIYKNIQKRVFAKAAKVDLACYESTEFYDKYMKAVNETNQISQTVLSSAGNMISNILTVFSVSLMIFIIDPIFILFTVVPVIYTLIFGKKLNRLYYNRDMEMVEKTRKRDYIKRTFYLADYAKEMRLTNISNVLFGRFIETVKELKQTIHKHGLKISILDYWSIVIQWVLLFIGSIIYSVYRTVVTKTMLFGDCVIIINNIVSTASAIQGIVNGYMQFHRHALSVENIRIFLEYESNICEDINGRDTDENNSLTLDNVSFHYGNQDNLVLKNINISINPGEKIALVGHNGAGKSTLVKLLMRLYDPAEGSIKLNGINIKEYKLSSYRNLFAAVFQQYKVFSMSIMQNILLKENITEEDKEQAVAGMKNSGVYDKVVSLPKKYDTVLTKEFDSDGVIFSGGEYQKIAVARVFTKPSCQFVILDEPSSALDPIAEFKMYEAMMKACVNKSVIYISHRLSSAVLADKVYMLENGEIAERGTHAELLAQNGKYADMWRKQAEQYQYMKGVETSNV